MRIYTRGGDKGKTGIHGGEGVDKDDTRIEANGTLDELNAEIGRIVARQAELRASIDEIVADLEGTK